MIWIFNTCRVGLEIFAYRIFFTDHFCHTFCDDHPIQRITRIGGIKFAAVQQFDIQVFLDNHNQR